MNSSDISSLYLLEEGCLPETTKETLESMPYRIAFRITNYCDYQCENCENLNVKNENKAFFPSLAIKSLLNDAKNDKQFVGKVYYKGGEPFTAHKLHEKRYMPDIMTHALDNGFKLGVQTNAVWSAGESSKEIMSYLKQLGIQYGSDLTINLDINKRRANCVKNNTALIQELVNAGKSPNFSVNAFDYENKLIAEFTQNLADGGIVKDRLNLGSGIVLWLKNGIKMKVKYRKLGTKRCNALAPLGLENYNPELDFLSEAEPFIIADLSGRIGLGGITQPYITTNWHDERGAVKSLAQIRQELLDNAVSHAVKKQTMFNR